MSGNYNTGGFTDFIADILKAAASSGVKQLTDDPGKAKDAKLDPSPIANAQAATMKVSPPPDPGKRFPIWGWLLIGYLVMKSGR